MGVGALAWRERKAPVRWSATLGRGICERLAQGELLYAICRDPGMPTPEGVATWARGKPAFAEELRAARLAGGRPEGTRGPVFSYCEATGQTIYERLCEGESLTAIGRDPTMPSLSTIFYWRRRIPAFEALVQTGKAIQAERFCDLACELAAEATPETAYLTHVRLTHLRWTAGVMAPKVFKLKPVDAPEPRQQLNVLMRRFEIEEDPATGQTKVVAYCPNPETGEVEREDVPGWKRPPGVSLPG
jgi:hypothetical protein